MIIKVMETVFVTGAGGYIGSILVRKLLTKGYRVIALDRFFFGRDKLPTHKNLIVVQDDARYYNPDILKLADYVIDLVAISNDPAGETFKEATWDINYRSRVRTAKYSKEFGVKRYILASSCSVYGFQKSNILLDENSKTNPLTTYAKANLKAEEEILPLANNSFTVAVLRQATVFGVSPRMRFDLALNGMVYGAWKNGKLPLMRDGTQYRPLIHVEDTTEAMIQLLQAPKEKINGEIFNVGLDNFQIATLGKIVKETVEKLTGKKVEIEWYGDPDKRSYRVSFEKIKKILDWKPKRDIHYGIKELVEALESGKLEKTKQTITLEWYKELHNWFNLIKQIEMYGKLL